MLFRSSVAMRDRTEMLPSPCEWPVEAPEPKLPLSVSKEPDFGGDWRPGFSVLLSAAGTYIGFFCGRI